MNKIFSFTTDIKFQSDASSAQIYFICETKAQMLAK